MQSPYRLAPMFNTTSGIKFQESLNKSGRNLTTDEDFDHSNLLSPLMDPRNNDEYLLHSTTGGVGGFNKSKESLVTENSIINTEESVIKIKVYIKSDN